VEDDIDPVPRGRVTYPDNLSDPSNTADYLIITNNTFYYEAKYNLPTVIGNQPTVEMTYPYDFNRYYGRVLVIRGNATDPDKDRIESVHIWESYYGSFNDNISFDDNHGNVSWQYTAELAEGANTIRMQAFDGDEYSNEVWFNIIVRNSDPYPPIARALPEYQAVEIGEYAVFNGSESYDPNGDELNFTWHINEQELSGETVQYQFVETGLYEVTLNVSDGMLWDTDTCYVYVNETVPPPNNPPFAFGLPVSQIVELGDPASFDASSSYDPDGDA